MVGPLDMCAGPTGITSNFTPVTTASKDAAGRLPQVSDSNAVARSCRYGIASFPGLPRFFLVCIDNDTRMRKGGEKRGRPGNEARYGTYTYESTD